MRIRYARRVASSSSSFSCVGCNFRLYWSCSLLGLFTAIQSFSYASYFCLKTPPLPALLLLLHLPQHSLAASNHAFACKSAAHRWRNMPGICMQIYLHDATRHRSRIGSGTAIGLRSYIPPYRGPICQSVSYRMTYCNTRSRAVPAHANCLRGVLGPTETRTNANYTGLQVS